MRNYRHAPGHVLDGISSEPTVVLKINYVPHDLSISRVLGHVYRCTDIVPGSVFDKVQDALLDYGIRQQTYAACAQAILRKMKAERTA
jgi:hypothetical protein